MKTRLTSNEDVYKLARRLAETARAMGDTVSAEALEDALRAGTTAAEQLGELRLALRRLRARGLSAWPEGTLETIDAAVDGIDKAFLRAGQGG